MLRWCSSLIATLVACYAFALMVNMSRPFAVPPSDAKYGVLVTGCASGLGYDLVRALTEDFPENKNLVVFAGVRKDQDLHLFDAFPHRNRIVPLVLDVADPKQVEKAVKTVESSGVPLYGLVNNAGIGMAAKRISKHSGSEYSKAVSDVLDINILGLSHLTGASMDLLKDASQKLGSARIVNVGSVMGLVYTPTCGGYCSSKHALEALTADWRYELDKFNVSVSIVQPGFIKTNMCNKHFCKDDPAVCSRSVMQALFSKRPISRYQCASVFGIPASVITALVSVVPDRAVDFVLRAFEDLEKKGAL